MTAGFDPRRPFVLLDDVASGEARLFSGLIEIVETAIPAEVTDCIDRLRAPGDWAGFLGFEAGHALEPRLLPLARAAPAGEPLLWFGRFGSVQQVDALALLPDTAVHIGPLAPQMAEADHEARLARIAEFIAAGDIYQANLTFGAAVALGGDPLALYRALRPGSRAPYGALLFTGRLWVLSFSPELFFDLRGGRLTARPMKGTMVRGHDAADDAARGARLQNDPKNRAENLMIVDLLRNDLSRVGHDVQVPNLFEIETYPTVLQMTSTITATANPGVLAADVLERLFPCGSVTGAPKIRAMEVIAEVEAGPRGIYTGSIGAIRASGDAVFNVAIRTLVLAGGQARLGLGSGIVADSVAGDEWQECLAKAAFLNRRGPPDLVETMRCEAGVLPDLERHLARMADSAAWVGFALDKAMARAILEAATAGFTGRVRLLAAPSGALAVQCSRLPATPAMAEVRAVPLPVDPGDWRLRHKTLDRKFYDTARGQAFEVVLVRPDGRVTEGSFTNVFVERGGILLTPPLAFGLLPGVLRGRLIDEGRAVEAELTLEDLADGFWLGNAVRGLFAARLVV